MSETAHSTIDYTCLVKGDRIHASLYRDPRAFDDEMESHKKVVLINAAEPLPNLAFLI